MHSADNYDECKEKLIAGLCYRVGLNGAITRPPQSCSKRAGPKGMVPGVYKWSALPAGSRGRSPGQCFAVDVFKPKDGPQESVNCNPKDGPREDLDFFSQVQKCGYYKPKCKNLTVVLANVDYPKFDGNIPSLTYIVQFDTGTYPNEDCHEMIVKGGNYGCMGGCGPGCAKLGWSLDCLKHDVCSAWNALRLNKPSTGFCADVDCGDEAAQTTYSCTSKNTKEEEICEDGKTTGSFWITGKVGHFAQCPKFVGKVKGQGLLE